MASEFIGYDVLVTLRAPAGGKLQGQVANVIGQSLLLQNVILMWNGQRIPQYSIDAANIADLSLQTTTSAPPQPQHAPQGTPNTTAAAPPLPPPQHRPQQQFVDPAILSFSKPPSQPNQPPAHSPVEAGIQRTPANVSAALTEPFSHLGLNAGGRATESLEALPAKELQNTPNAKQTPRRNRRDNGEALNKHGAAASTNPKSKGWRQTAFVEPAAPPNQASPSTPGAKLRRKKNRQPYAEDASGWATEDATDIQELGEFDFQTNLSKFDKHRVFAEIRNDDTTADEARLVSFNRKAKPGTNGGKNLHWTENVLDSPQNSESDDDVEQISDARLSGDTRSGRERSRASVRIQPTRKGSGVLGQPSFIPPQINTLSRSQTLNTSRTTSPRPGRVSASPKVGPGVSGASLRLTTTNRSCPTVSPLQTLEVEQIAVAEFSLTEDLITENAGRGIAEAAVALLSNDAAAPTMLILTGNHRTGARAVSAARHLRNRGHRVTLCMLGLEHENELLESCRKQLDIFRKIGGRVLKWEELSGRLSTSEVDPDLVIDALFGMHVAFDDLRNDDQAVAFEMISWMNRDSANILSVDVPSGLSATTGEVTMVEGSPLCVNATSVVCLGAPKTGILSASLSGEELSWSLAVADIGIPQIVWRKYGTRRRHGIDFGNRWVVPLRFQPSAI
ncbi:hypothetical protein N7510_004266 [Penicillium lagena]|uniref:uncharacterized protein n=1 Tax=Penicillium lagena TaxID=94218 RepID=UPI0025402A36|nr:uncharacterized protein N7510_004266 [Penicillium lagena]KAJ5620282.1 hypothetical protein N7510_004266 [Penicillium lagena]